MKALKMLCASLILASAHAAAADTRYGKAEQVAVERASHEQALRTAAVSHSGGVEARFALAQAEEGLDPARSGRNVVRLYPVAAGESSASGTAESSARAGQPSKGSAVPEPGSWAMILAGLLGVGAIARRRI